MVSTVWRGAQTQREGMQPMRLPLQTTHDQTAHCRHGRTASDTSTNL